MTLECNGVHGEWSFAEAERRADFLLALGRTMPPSQWCTGLILRGEREANGAVLEGLI